MKYSVISSLALIGCLQSVIVQGVEYSPDHGWLPNDVWAWGWSGNQIYTTPEAAAAATVKHCKEKPYVPHTRVDCELIDGSVTVTQDCRPGHCNSRSFYQSAYIDMRATVPMKVRWLYSDWQDSYTSVIRIRLPDGVVAVGPRPEVTTVVSKELGKPQNCVGNPISIATGNKFQQETLLAGLLPLRLNYNSLDQTWRHNYSYRLSVSAGTASLIRPDGKGISFTRSDTGWRADDDDVFYQLAELVDQADSAVWQVTNQTGNIEHYDNEGQLLSITNLRGQTVNLAYAQNQILIRDEFENTLQLNVNADGLLTSASLNGIVQAQLNTDTDGRLLSRTDAAGQTTTYHYENTNFPKHLTGITGADGVRFATWAYDDQGRGVLSEHAGQERATLAFNDDDSTTVTNSLGKQTTYRFETIQRLKRPVAIEGHATENCIAANKAYTYHANGLVETQTDWSGNVTRFEYNDRGLMTRRVEAEGTPQQRETLTAWHAELPLRVEQIIAGEKTTYSYDAQNRLSATETLVAE